MRKITIGREMLRRGMNYSSTTRLKEYLSEAGVPYGPADRKVELVGKVLDSIHSYEDLLGLAPYVALRTSDAKRALNITETRYRHLVRMGALIPMDTKGYRKPQTLCPLQSVLNLMEGQVMEKELHVSAYELSCITGRPLPDILQDMRDGRIQYGWLQDNRMIPLSQFYIRKPVTEAAKK